LSLGVALSLERLWAKKNKGKKDNGKTDLSMILLGRHV